MDTAGVCLVVHLVGEHFWSDNNDVIHLLLKYKYHERKNKPFVYFELDGYEIEAFQQI